MIKRDYKKELKLETPLKKGDKGHEVEKVQEWICLNHEPHQSKPIIAIDGDFRQKKKKAVKAFQKKNKLVVNGQVDPETWSHLCLPMKEAFMSAYKCKDPRDTIIKVAMNHLRAHPRELNNKNEGPWVRAYMGGHDGNPWAWCVGSALTVIDQALSAHFKKFTDFYPNTYSCDVMGEHAKKNKTLIRNKDLRKLSISDLYEQVKPGDLLQVSKTPTDWTHCALILEVHEDHCVTAEGNTNDEGSREGYEFVKRKRNFHTQKLDVLTLDI